MILMIYSSNACREFLLPNIHDADYELRLDKENFRLSKSVKVNLEVTAEGWRIQKSEAYYLKYQGVHEDSHLLRHGDILEIKTRRGESLQVITAGSMLSFQVMKKYDISAMKEISIGKSAGNIIQYQFMELVSASHATLHRHSDGWYLYDQSSNGVFTEKERVRGKYRLNFGDHLHIFGLHLVFLNDILAVGTYIGELHVNESILKAREGKEWPAGNGETRPVREQKYFNRSPRNLPVIYHEKEEIESPPSPKTVKERPLFLTIGPAFTMAIPMMLGCGFAIFGSKMSGMTSSAFMYTGLITALASAVIGVIWAVMNLKYSSREQLEEETQRFNAYSNYLIRIADSLREKYQHNTEAMLQIYPSSRQCVMYDERHSSLWNRNYSHDDFLFLRLGLGDQPFQVEISIPKEKFTLINDSLLEKPKKISDEFQTLHQVPVGISLLKKRLVGVIGGEKKQGAVEIMHSMVAQIVANHCYTDVKMVFIYREEDEGRAKDWECMRWFPHVWSEDKQTRYMAANEVETGDIFFELANVLRIRCQNSKKTTARPHYILFLSDPALVEGELLAKYIYDLQEEYGLTTVFLAERVEQLPNVCEDVIENDQYFRGVYNLMDTFSIKKEVAFDKVSREQLEQMGRKIADIQVNELESSSEIPSSLEFFEMYGVYSPEKLDVLDRWRKNRTYNSMKALIGKKSGNADCFLDIHEKYHGPHGLIAGTTGSGKSETLQTYMLSLAINFSPEDICFFIIDFKGGGMANLFSDLPHLSGQISNLSGNQVRRAMISIKSENMRRQKLFTDYGVNNINLYTRLYKNHEAQIPIPHLFIIIDEFAELKREEPEFMKELISVAQVGRSLGVHLILATQKPSGTVDDNIWSNSKFRLCLRVQDRQDSNDMLHKPDAAFITQAGRCYLQVGNDEIFELFQSGYSGAVYEEGMEGQSTAATLLTRTGKTAVVGSRNRMKKKALQKSAVKEETQLDAVIKYLNVVADNNGYSKTMQLWLPVLKEAVYLEELEGYKERIFDGQNWKKRPGKWNLEAVVGIYDDPEKQAQNPLKISFSDNGHYAVCGSVVSGKSTFLQTMLCSLIHTYTPGQLQLYILDFSSHLLAPFEEAPHTGGIIYDTQEDKLAKFMFMLTAMMDERKEKFQGGNYEQYMQAYGESLPAVLIVIDNFSNFREKSHCKYDDIIFRLSREGVGYGIYLAVSAAGFGSGEIPARIGDNIRTVISLEQADKFKYMEVMRVTRLPILPECDVKGRGLALADGRILEFQTALSVEAEDDFARGQILTRQCQKMKSIWKGVRPGKIPEIPDDPTLTMLKEEAGYKEALQKGDALPYAYRTEDASVYSVMLSDTYCYVISGRSRTGKTNVLKLLLDASRQRKDKICVIENERSELKKAAEEYNASYLTDEKEMFEYFKALIPEFARRNKLKHQYLESGMDEMEVYQQMKKEETIAIFIADLGSFFRKIYKPEGNVGNMSGFLENIMEKGRLHGIYFFGCLSVEDEPVLISYKAYKHYISYKKGVHLGGNLSMQKVFTFQNVSFNTGSKAAKKGMGYVPDAEDDTIGLQVVIPLARKGSQ